MPTKRVFVAILSSAEIRKHVRRWQAGHGELPVRWIPEEDLHVTVVPPWQEGDFEAIAGRLEMLRGKVASFELSFRRIAYGPEPRRPRLIWAMGETTQGLNDLRMEIFRLLGAEPIERSFRPHLTLARLRPKDRSYLPAKLGEEIAWIEKVEAVCLVESILGPERAVYKVLKEVSLE